MTNKELEDRFLAEVLPFSKIVYKVCHQYTGNNNDFNDLFQEVLFQLWKSFPNFNHQSKTSTWIYKVALNTSLYYRRKEKRQLPTIDLIDECFRISDSEAETTQDQLSRLHDLIGKLSDIEKAIIILHLDDYSNDEISTIMGLSKTNVSTRLNRIKNKLKNGKSK